MDMKAGLRNEYITIHNIMSVIEEKQTLLEETAAFLWEHPETAFTEFQSE